MLELAVLWNSHVIAKMIVKNDLNAPVKEMAIIVFFCGSLSLERKSSHFTGTVGSRLYSEKTVFYWLMSVYSIHKNIPQIISSHFEDLYQRANKW